MIGIRVLFLAEEPLIISDSISEGIQHKCLDYIPGNMLLGACVARWKAMHPGVFPDDNAEFCDIFLGDKVSFGHAYPACFGRSSYPTPLSLYYVKKYKGLPSCTTNADAKTPPVVYNFAVMNPDDLTEKQQAEEATKRLSTSFLDFESRHAPDVEHVHAVHVAIDPKKRIAQEHQLFAFEAIRKGTEFCGTILCDKSCLTALKACLTPGTRFQIGHARSAGYGTVSVKDVSEIKADAHVSVAKGRHILYLESAFFPETTWQTPLESLQKTLSEHLGEVRFDTAKSMSDTLRMEGFNSIWRLPRHSRHGFAPGSVFVLTTEKDGKLPAALGAWQREGYGRYLLDPPLLGEQQIQPAVLTFESATPTEKKASAADSSPMLAVWRKLSSQRIAVQQAIDIVWHSPLFSDFFSSLTSYARPAQNQRGNIRRMLTAEEPETWIPAFQEMLGKQPGRQWKTVRAKDPFCGNQQNGNLDDIMLNLFDMERTEQLFSMEAANQDRIRNSRTISSKNLQSKSVRNEAKEKRIEEERVVAEKYSTLFQSLLEFPSFSMNQEEFLQFRRQRHRRMLLEFLRRWEKEVRSKEGSK